MADSETLQLKAKKALRELAIVAIDLVFVASYAAMIGAAAIGLHLLTNVLEVHGLTQFEVLPMVILAHALTWIDSISALFAAFTIVVESAIGRGKIVKAALDALRQ